MASVKFRPKLDTDSRPVTAIGNHERFQILRRHRHADQLATMSAGWGEPSLAYRSGGLFSVVQQLCHLW